jgi:D-alanine--poly(phosphoribitol) ligase subunit 2
MEELIQLLQSTLKIKPLLQADTPLLSSGLIDSFQVVALLAALETRYKVSIPPEDVDAESFDTPAQILAAIERQKS